MKKVKVNKTDNTDWMIKLFAFKSFGINKNSLNLMEYNYPSKRKDNKMKAGDKEEAFIYNGKIDLFQSRINSFQ